MSSIAVANLRAVLTVCEAREVGPYATKAAVLTGYAESDFNPDATQDGLESGKSFGVFQQKPQWWPTAHGTVQDQCNAFLNNFVSLQLSMDIVYDCWRVQRWYPSDKYDSASHETLNYTSRLPVIDWIIANRRLP